MTIAVTSIGSLLLIGELKDNKLAKPCVVLFDMPRGLITFIEFGAMIGDIDLSNYQYVTLSDECELARAFRQHRTGLVMAGGFGSA
jgi:hypothetical protein